MPRDVPPLPLLTIRPGRMVLRCAGAGGTGGAPETLAEFPYAEGAEDAALAAVAAALGPGAGPVALGLPESVVRVLTLKVAGGDVRRGAVAAALEGLTPYPVAELVFDWRADPGPDAPIGQVRVAVVARETLAEAAAALGAHGLALGAALADGLAGFEGPARFDLAAPEPELPPVVRATPAAPAEALERIVGRLAILRAPARSGRRALGIALTTAAVVGGLALLALAGRGGGHAEAERAALSATAPLAEAPRSTAPAIDGRLAQAVTGEAPAEGTVRSDAAAPSAVVAARDPTLSRIGAVAAAAQPRLLALTPPAIAALTQADPPARGLPPPPPGVVYTLDPEGAVMPTAEGVLLADGVRLFAGAPPVVPPLPPGRVAAPPPTPESAAADPVGAAVAAAVDAAVGAGQEVAGQAGAPEPGAEPEAPRAAGPVAIPPPSPAVRAALLAAEARRSVAPPPLPPRLARPAPAADPASPPDAAPDAEQPAAAPDAAAAPAEPAPAAASDPAAGAAPAAPVPASGALAFAPPPRPFAAAPQAAATAPQPRLAFAPPARPANLAPPRAAPPAAAAQAGTRSAVAAPPPRPAGLRAPTRRADPGAPAVVSSGEAVRTPSGTERIVAREATSRGLDMGRVNLIGVFGTQQNRTALIREVDGRIRRVKVGDRIEGGRVAAIGSDELRYVRDGQNVTLRMPRN